VLLRTGHSHNCVLISPGNVTKCWGQNNHGQLGLGDTTNRFEATEVTALGNVGVTNLELGTADSACAQTRTGTVLCWGKNDYGQLGLGDTTERHTPTLVPALGTSVRQLALGWRHSCALLHDATTKCWGKNADYELGLGDTATRTTPTTVSALGTSVQQIAVASYGTSCALLMDGTVQCWGSFWGFGCTAYGSTPTTISGFTTSVTRIALGTQHACALLANKQVQCWAHHGEGQLGIGSSNNIICGCCRGSMMPVTLPDLGTNATQVSVHHHGSCARMQDGTVKCWGWNARDSGGSSSPEDIPVASAAVFVTAGAVHSCALLANGVVQCWGRSNGAGQLGVGNTLVTVLSPTL